MRCNNAVLVVAQLYVFIGFKNVV